MDKIYAVISADIVGSTTMSKEDMVSLADEIKKELVELANTIDGFWGRLVKGDTIECVIPDASNALWVATLLKCKIKGIMNDSASKRSKNCGLRLAIGIGKMRIIDKDNDIMDGDAIYLAGRAINDMNKKGQMMTVICNDKNISEDLGIIAKMINCIVNNIQQRQCQTLYERLKCDTDEEVANKAGKTRQAINMSLNAIGWNEINDAIGYFRKKIKDYCNE